MLNHHLSHGSWSYDNTHKITKPSGWRGWWHNNPHTAECWHLPAKINSGKIGSSPCSKSEIYPVTEEFATENGRFLFVDSPIEMVICHNFLYVHQRVTRKNWNFMGFHGIWCWFNHRKMVVEPPNITKLVSITTRGSIELVGCGY